MLKKNYKTLILSVGALALFAGLFATLGTGNSLAYIDYHPMKVVFNLFQAGL